jgi:hypothetical protein
MKDNVEKASLGKRAAHELKQFSILAIYLYVCFTALAYLKAAILEAQGVVFAPFGFAAVKALICAKLLSIGYVFHLGERYKKQALIWPTLHRSFVFLVLLIVLTMLEELTVGYLHHRAFAIPSPKSAAARFIRRSQRDHPAVDLDSFLCLPLSCRSRRRTRVVSSVLRAAPKA